MTSKDSIDFLKLLHPSSLWALCAIEVDQTGIYTKTFSIDTVELCEKWIDNFNGRCNLYFHINPPDRELSKKAERIDIKELAYLHVDIDPVNSSDESREACLRQLLHLPVGVPEPTWIVFSGGGYQAFWQLKHPVLINKNLDIAEDVKRYNQQLEVIFNADNCHNIDRLCRLPGTLNIPGKTKIKKGRIEKYASVLIHKPDNIYDLRKFTPLPLTQSEANLGIVTTNPTTLVSANIRRLDSIDELDRWDIPDRIKIIIVQGSHPDETKKVDNSRSAWLFDALCGMIRAGVPDEVMYSIITDPGFLISESVLDKKANSESYALRQIQRAKEHAIDPWLRELNDRFAVISNIGGKCRIVEELLDCVLNRTKLSFQSFADFRSRYLHKQLQVGETKKGLPKMMNVAQWWLEHQSRRQFDSVVFAPGRITPNSYNLWKGFSVDPLYGRKHLKFLSHIKDNICNNNEEYFNYLMNWLARCFQKPDCQGQTAIVLRGRQGTGKSFFVSHLGQLLGRHYLQVSDPKHLVGSFNAHLRDCVMLFGDEAFYAGDKKHESVLKTLITEDLLTIEGKGVDVEVAPNCTHVLLSSNSQWVVPAGADERRFFVLDVSDEKMQQSKYFKDIAVSLKDGGYNHLLHHLLTMNISEFNVRDVPKTEALRDQKMYSMSPDEEWWFNQLTEGRNLGAEDGWCREIDKNALYDEYVRYMQQLGVSRKSSITNLGRFLHKVCNNDIEQFTKICQVTDYDGVYKKIRKYYYFIPDLNACRNHWDKLYSTDIPWLAIN